MSGTGPEQRRSRRIAPDDCYLRLIVRVPVLMRDVGHGGAQLESSVSVPADSDAQLRTMLHGRPFEPDVEVAWSAAGQGADVTACRLGINFKTMDDGSRKALANFLVTAPEPDA